jgi:hypothetical protein
MLVGKQRKETAMRTSTSKLLIAALIFSLASPLILAKDKKGAELHSVRLYLPDEELSHRLGDDAGPLGNYIKALVQVAKDYLEKSPQPGAKGMLIAVGIKPGKRSRAWCEAVEGKIPPAVLSDLEKTLAEAPTIDVKDAPMAFAIELQLGAAKVKEFPVFPKTWSEASNKSSEPLIIPDQLFKVIWPD